MELTHTGMLYVLTPQQVQAYCSMTHKIHAYCFMMNLIFSEWSSNQNTAEDDRFSSALHSWKIMFENVMNAVYKAKKDTNMGFFWGQEIPEQIIEAAIRNLLNQEH